MVWIWWCHLPGFKQRCRSSLWTSDLTHYDTQSILGFLETHMPQGSSKPIKLFFFCFFLTTFTILFIVLPLSNWDWITSFYTHVHTHTLYIYIYTMCAYTKHTYYSDIYIHKHIWTQICMHTHTHTHTQILSKSLFVCILNVFTNFLIHI